MSEKRDEEKFRIKSAHAELKTWLHPIQNHVVLKVNDWSSMLVDRGDGDEDEYEYGEASIMLDKKRAIALRDNLNELLNIMSE